MYADEFVLIVYNTATPASLLDSGSDGRSSHCVVELLYLSTVDIVIWDLYELIVCVISPPITYNIPSAAATAGLARLPFIGVTKLQVFCNVTL